MTSALPPEPPSSAAPSAVFTRSERLTPRVRQADSPLVVGLGLLGAGFVGVLVFSQMSSNRRARAQPAPPAPAAAPAAAPAPAPPTPASASPAAVVSGPAAIVLTQTGGGIADPNEAHWRAPAMVVDLSEPATNPSTRLAFAVPAVGAAPAAGADDAKLSADERFAQKVAGSQVDVAHASQMRDLARTAPQGTLIAAVLETAINSDLPGSVRAVVSRDVRGFDGSQVLIPRGSKLIGQYRSGVAIGQTRAFVVWSRLITPSGVSVDIGSPATDQLGRGGLDGETDEHFFRRFGASILLSVMTAGLDAAVPSRSGNVNAVVIGSPQQASNIASIALQRQIDIPVTIKVAQGTPLQVFVTRDLDFSGVPAVAP
jgi:type IV secretion system protein VirB10